MLCCASATCLGSCGSVETSCSLGFSDSSCSSEMDVQKICGYQSDSSHDLDDTIVLWTGDSGLDRTAVLGETTDTNSDNISTDMVPTFTKPLVEQKNDENEQQKVVTNILMTNCCSNDCLLYLTGYTVLMSRRKVCCLQGSKRRQWIID